MKKNPDRIEFENKCKAYERRTLFLRIFVTYIVPLYIVISICAVCAFIIRDPAFSSTNTIILCIFEVGKSFFMYVARKESFKLTKKAYYYLLACGILICITGLITEGIQQLPSAIAIFAFYFFYMYKRSFLFGVK